MVPDHPGVAVLPAAAQDPPQPRRDPRRLAEWAGLACLTFVLGSGVLGLWIRRGNLSGDQNPLGALHQTALVAGLTAAVCLWVARPRWPVAAFSGMVAVWTTAGAVSGWALTGQPELSFLLLGVTAFGLVIGAAAVSPIRSGWVILLAGVTLVTANWVALWVNYSTQGASFPRSGHWRGSPTYGLGFFTWLEEALLHDIPGYVPTGLTANSSFTGKLLVFFVVFSVPFLLSRWRSQPARGGQHRPVAWVLVLLLTTVPGLLLLIVLRAHGATAAVVLGWAVLLIPRLPRASRRGAWLAAVMVPAAVLVPVLFGLAGLVRLNGRDCVWRDWVDAIFGTLPWGLGPPGSFPGTRCGVPKWAHAHNELLNALTLGGVVGLVAATITVGFLAWFAVRFHSADQRCLLSQMVCATVIMSMNVVSVARVDWILPGMAAFIAIAARSLRMMADQAAEPTATAARPGE